jgi:hypothetical protein
LQFESHALSLSFCDLLGAALGSGLQGRAIAARRPALALTARLYLIVTSSV